MEYHVFKYPYILIEDETGKHRPFFKEYSGDSKDTTVPKFSYAHVDFHKQSAPKDKCDKKPGVCEMCVLRYSNYESHISDKKHVAAARGAASYEEVDRLILALKKEKTVRSPRGAKKRLFEQIN